MNRNLLPLLYLLCVVSVLSCDNSPKIYNLPEDLVAYFNYQRGSYWILKDSLTGDKDSLYVTDYERKFDLIPGYMFTRTHKYDRIRIGMQNTTGAHSLLTITAGGKDHSYSTLNFDNRDYLVFTEDMPFLVYSDSVLFKNVWADVTVNGNPYDNVYEYRRKISAGRSDDILINAAHGFIKLSVGADTSRRVWVLERSDIVR